MSPLADFLSFDKLKKKNNARGTFSKERPPRAPKNLLKDTAFGNAPNAVSDIFAILSVIHFIIVIMISVVSSSFALAGLNV